VKTTADKVREWESTLGRRTILDQIDEIAEAVTDPLNADADQCWQVAWPIPLFAHTTVGNGMGMVERLRPHMEQGWRTWGERSGPITVKHLGGSNEAANFTVAGKYAEVIRNCRIAPHRLLAIQGAAKGIRQLVKYDEASPPFAAVAKKPLNELVPELVEIFGRGWGHISVLHFLTDLGLAVKPDLHLVKTVQSLGLLNDLEPERVPSLAQALAINEEVRRLAAQLNGGQYTPRQLRRLDALLMEVSRQRLINRLNKETT
tara:strand:+ start:11310 stop:12089 length:780 start_codon:yes stop_codon:yes gene_type:complete